MLEAVDFWTVLSIFGIVAVPAGLLTRLTAWTLRRYDRNSRAREAPHEGEKNRPHAVMAEPMW